MRQRHAVTDKQDDVLRLARPGVEEVPGDFAGLRAYCNFHLVIAGALQRHIAQHQRRLILVVLTFDKARCTTQQFGVILSVDRDRHIRRFDEAGELDLKVEFCANQHLGPVERIDGLRLCTRGRQQKSNSR